MSENMNMSELAPANENKTNHSIFDAGFLYGLYEFAATYFEAQLRRSPEANEFCQLRRVSEARLCECRVGFAPESGSEFCDLLQRHCTTDLCRECGLLSWKADGAYLSKFRGRLMFPIYDDQGRVVAFSGLSLATDEKKGPRWLEPGLITMIYSPANPPLNIKNIAMRVLQLQMLAAELDVEACQELALTGTPMRALVKMVGMLGMRYGDR